MSDVFISYSRRDADFMAALHTRLTADGHDVWVDWEDIPPTADWWAEIKAAIEEANSFTFIISPHSIASDICRQEIQHAIDNNKRFVPVLYQPIDPDGMEVHPAIKTHNWIVFKDGQLDDEAYQKLVDSFTTDPDYLRRHTRLLVRAKEWKDNDREPAYMLEGAELREFQQWLSQSQSLSPKPTELQYDFILASQTQRFRVQLRIAGGLLIGFIIVAFLAGITFFQSQLLDNQEATSVAQSTQLAAQQTSIVEARANVIEEANARNTQEALEGQIIALQVTIETFNTQFAANSVPTLTPTSTPTATQTPTLPPTWTPTAGADEDSVGDGDAVAQSVSTATLDPNLLLTATAQRALYATATQQAVASPTPPPTLTPPPTVTLLPTATVDAPEPVSFTEETIRYTVQTGDVALEIAERFGISVQDLMEANNLSNASLIFVGQALQIPYQLGVATDQVLLVAPSGQDTADCGADTMPCRTIQGALAATDGIAQIRLASGVYQERLVLTQDVALVGNGADRTIISGNFTESVITVLPDVQVNLLNMTITGGGGNWGAGIVNYGDATIQNVRIAGNAADFVGGGIANFGRLFGNSIDFEENYAPYFSDVYNVPGAGVITEGDEGMTYEAETSLPPPQNVDSPINIGALVRVTTTEGDTLNFRPNPNANANPIGQLPAGTPLLVIGGPRNNNNFRWWQVQTLEGRVGWVVEFAEVATLQIIREPLPDR